MPIPFLVKYIFGAVISKPILAAPSSSRSSCPQEISGYLRWARIEYLWIAIVIKPSYRNTWLGHYIDHVDLVTECRWRRRRRRFWGFLRRDVWPWRQCFLKPSEVETESKLFYRYCLGHRWLDRVARQFVNLGQKQTDQSRLLTKQ